MEKLLPECLLIGAAKSGTTSLAFYLSQHPDVLLAKDKEAHFFDSDERYSRGLVYFRDQFFSKAKQEKVWIDATPGYMHLYGKTISRIKESYGESTPRFVVVLRDPVKRSYSHYKHRVRNGKEVLSFEEAIKAESERIDNDPDEWWRYRSDSLYGEQLEAWFRAFGADQFLVIKQEQLRADPLGTTNSVLRFLSIDQPLEALDGGAQNPASEPRFRWLNRLLNVPLPLPRWITRKLLGEAGQRLRKRLRKLNQVPENSPDSTAQPNEDWMKGFRQTFSEDLRRLEALTQRSFDEWK
ncbi:sulfotransferase domain-containing protein [Tamilnaduibacter salinus]|uniref:Sulfotransferase domain-containing protein n=1 Tax=Tamilnaduibacter salinus TaxID=1484056 RepID=A0A2A2I139_9GAMM|nr:sulfotransferase [Tamilnaduibacter salinus]PAV24994.1 hypothetical protein CF392_13315 [Tamilnaduibacter salinus]PVY70831.1 sulfotransferase domain-containing protein [Tamilnaduibacter salinus]